MQIKDVHSRLNVIEERLDTHIHDGTGVWTAIEGVRTDLKWLKQAFWVLVGLGVTFVGLLLKIVLSTGTVK